jgi:hypothetical protein
VCAKGHKEKLGIEDPAYCLQRTIPGHRAFTDYFIPLELATGSSSSYFSTASELDGWGTNVGSSLDGVWGAQNT